MDKARWQQIEAIFAEAVDLPHEAARAYLDAQCSGDENLRQEVEILLESDRRAQRAGRSVRDAVGQAAAAFAVQMQRDYSASQIGRRIGPYEIVREIGRGGMGSVYQAVRIDEQYIRSVAIKFIAQGSDTADALARFKTERQILASLQHPNIAGLLDGGTTEDALPYIVMEYIEGQPLLEYCNSRNLSLHERLDLFCSLCGAVHYAHQMLVIHRDIKPANVLVTEQGIPKLLDFGIAKLLTADFVVGGAQNTKTQMRRLTPQYASPEQVRGEALTTATDIYSLGVLLYELLTKSSPYRITGEAAQEVERLVCDSEPIRLSMATWVDAKLRKQLSGDLENIVSMALRKEPQRRYASVQQFSDDVCRYMDGLPVSAREDTIFYLATKLVRRNKLAAAAFALLALSIFSGWFATYREARRAEARFEEVRKLANVVLFDFHKKIQGLPGATPARELLVRTALQYLNKLSADSAHDPSLQWDLSQAYEQVGDVQGDPSGANLGQFREALVSYNKALELVVPLSKKRHDYSTLSCIAWLHFKCGDLELRTTGVGSAVESYSEGLRVSEEVGTKLRDPRANSLLLNGYMRMARTKTRIGAANQALQFAHLAVDAADRDAKGRGANATPDMARTRLLLGNLLWLRGDLQGAWTRIIEAVRWLEELVTKDRDNPTLLDQLEEAYRRAGDLQGNPSYFHLGDMEQAKFYHQKALRIAQQLSDRDPNDAQARAHLSLAFRRMGAVQRGSHPAGAAKLYQQSLSLLKPLMTESPEDLNYRRDLANTQLGLAIALQNARKYKQASTEAASALTLQRAILQRSPDRMVVREDSFDSMITLGQLRLATGDSTEALALYTEALRNAEFLYDRNKENLYAERCLAIAYESMGDYYARDDRTRSNAREWYGKALAVWTQWRIGNLAMPFAARREDELKRRMVSAGLL
jgi:serine/threonine protein kinase